MVFDINYTVPQIWVASTFSYFTNNAKKQGDKLDISFQESLAISAALLIILIALRKERKKEVTITKDNYKAFKQVQINNRDNQELGTISLV